MASKELIDARFDRAVQIVQGLPNTGPIQTGHEEKLTMYSLYKQATVGNVKTPRPGIWDMLGRAKWDAWAKHKDLGPYEAKWLYVEALLKVLRRYSDKTMAKSLVDELESYQGSDASNAILNRDDAPSEEAGEKPSELLATNFIDMFTWIADFPDTFGLVQGDMASKELIDAQFDRAVQIVRGLPETCPIQTDYEEKLTMYSLYRQVTVGNVNTLRPGIWDMLGRAKWDAWAKHKDLDPYEAKWLYVEALLKVLRRYSDKTTAKPLVDEDASNTRR
ncbi:acyl-CoA-binding protein [Amanita rubescens]|nr:acyl-CoA-binding protein [Amanita rubescens]